jgi:hypothetical protein
MAKLRTPEAIKAAREAGLEKTELVIALRGDIDTLNKKIMELDDVMVLIQDLATKDLAIVEKELAKVGKRVVALTDVTVTRDTLLMAVKKSNKLPGNEVQAFVDFLLKKIIMEKK